MLETYQAQQQLMHGQQGNSWKQKHRQEAAHECWHLLATNWATVVQENNFTVHLYQKMAILLQICQELSNPRTLVRWWIATNKTWNLQRTSHKTSILNSVETRPISRSLKSISKTMLSVNQREITIPTECGANHHVTTNNSTNWASLIWRTCRTFQTSRNQCKISSSCTNKLKHQKHRISFSK